jgi:hypothetical protein
LKFSEVLQQAADSSFVHPAGKKVPVTVNAAVYKQSKAGNPMIEVQLKVTGGPNAGKGRPIRYWLMLEFDTTVQQLTNVGIRKGELDQLAQYEMEQAGERLAAMLVGKKGAADIEQETYNSRLQNKVKWLNPAPGATGPAPVKPAPAAVPEVDPGDGDPWADEGYDETDDSGQEAVAAELRDRDRGRSPAPDDLPF